MKPYFHVGLCSSCRQGRLILQRIDRSRQIYAHCEECEWGFMEPEDVQYPERAFLTLSSDGDTSDPTIEEIAETVWAKHLIGIALI